MEKDPQDNVGEGLTKAELAAVRRIIRIFTTRPRYFVLPGGKAPRRMTTGAVGFDVYARAIVDAKSKPNSENPMRRTRADFIRANCSAVDAQLQEWISDPQGNSEHYAITLPPNEHCMVGLGFIMQMELDIEDGLAEFHWLTPRSGFASNRVTLSNAPGTVDPDYRGETGVLVVNESDEPFTVSRHMRIAQMVINIAKISDLIEVSSLADLEQTQRGAQGFGSTGSHG